jgi:hypothetical protein
VATRSKDPQRDYRAMVLLWEGGALGPLSTQRVRLQGVLGQKSRSFLLLGGQPEDLSLGGVHGVRNRRVAPLILPGYGPPLLGCSGLLQRPWTVAPTYTACLWPCHPLIKGGQT